jgi:alpha-1,2-glucosyltransferase
VSGRLDPVRLVLTAAVIVGTTLFAVAEMRPLDRHADETHHFRQITAFCNGDWSLDPKLTTVPGAHVLTALWARATGDCSLAAARRVNIVFGLLSVAAFLYAALATPTTRPLARTLQYFLLPILLPYHFLVYTDSVALLALLIAVGLLLRGRHVAAGLVGVLSLFLRQTNIVWLAFIAGYILLEQGWEGPKAYLRRAWPCVVGAVGFGVFVIWNGGVALGDARAHRAGVSLGNVFFLLMLLAVLFLPRNLARLAAEGERLADRGFLLVLALLYAVFLVHFGVEHAYNRFPGFLRNDLLVTLDERDVLRLSAFAVVAVGAAVLYVDRLARPSYHLLYVFAVLSLLPLKLIDQRYDFAPLALFLLFRKDDSVFVEAASVVFWLLLSGFLLDGIARGAFAL